MIESDSEYELESDCYAFNGDDFQESMEAVTYHGYNLKFVNENLQNTELVKTAVENCGSAIQYVRKDLVTQELCDIAFKNYPKAFSSFPEQFQTWEMCLYVARYHGYLVYCIADIFQLPELHREIVRYNYGFIDSPTFINEKYKTPELWYYAYGDRSVRKCGLALAFIENQTPKVCLEAVMQNSLALKYVHKQSKKLCIEAVRQNNAAINYVNPRYLKAVEGIEQKQPVLGYRKI